MLTMILELLAVGFILGLCITAVTLAALSAADVLVRTKHANAATGAPQIGQFGRPLGGARSQRGHAGSGQRRAA